MAYESDTFALICATNRRALAKTLDACAKSGESQRYVGAVNECRLVSERAVFRAEYLRPHAA